LILISRAAAAPARSIGLALVLAAVAFVSLGGPAEGQSAAPVISPGGCAESSAPASDSLAQTLRTTPHDHAGHDHGATAACGEATEDPFTISAHEASEGPALQTSQAEHEAPVFEGGGCPDGVVVRSYDVVAIPIVMVLNRWGDRDPDAFMFALREAIPAIRTQEAAVESFGLTPGVAADPI
jgi:hypothetical protein